MRSGKTVGEPLKHDWSVTSVFMGRDNQQIVSVDWNHKVHLWSVPTGELLKTATDVPDCARVLWMAKNKWNGGDDAATESSSTKPRVAVAGRDV